MRKDTERTVGESKRIKSMGRIGIRRDTRRIEREERKYHGRRKK